MICKRLLVPILGGVTLTIIASSPSDADLSSADYARAKTLYNSNQLREAPAARRSLLRRQPRILFDTIGGGGAEPGFGRGNGRRLGLAETHIQPHLAVGDVAAGQAAVPHRGEEPASYRPTATARKHDPLRGPAGRQIRNSGRATPSLRRASGDTPSS
jgi:hypothetical protein